MFANRTANARRRQRACSSARLRTLALVTVAAMLTGAWCAGAIGQTAAAKPDQTPGMPLNPAQQTTYRDVLVFGLQAKLPTELQFIDSVVAAVEDGTLPSKLVDQTFFWARNRAGSTHYGRATRPIIYFILGLQTRMNKLGLNVALAGGLP